MNNKKTFIIIVSVVIGLFIISIIGYYFVIRGNQTNTASPKSGFMGFLPFGGSDNPQPIPNQGELATTTEPQKNFTQKLRKISSEPVAGAGILDIKAGSVVRYTERANGHIYEVDLFSPKQERISNTTTPIAYDAVWGNKNNSFVVRYLKEDDETVDTYSMNLKQGIASTSVVVLGTSFPEKIDGVSSFGSSTFYLQKSDVSSLGYVSGFDGKQRRLIWNSPIKDILSQFVNAKTVALTTKPASNIGGSMYLVDTNSGQTTKVLSNVSGLSTIVSPDAGKVLAIAQESAVQMFLYDIKSRAVTNITPTTLPEKCVWSTKDKNVVYCAVPGEYLRGDSQSSWYKGLISFTDDVWKYDLKNNSASMVQNLLNESGEYIDVIKPILSENEQYLLFVNKKDNSLWSLDLLQ